MNTENRAVSISLVVLATIAVFYVLVVGKAFLVPLAVAVLVWYIINALSRTYTRFLPNTNEPNLLTMLMAVASVLLFIYLVINMIQGNIQDVRGSIPMYRENLAQLSSRITSVLPVASLPNLDQFTQSIEVGPIISTLAGSFTGMISNVFLVLLYVLFLLLEQGTFKNKLVEIFPSKEKREDILSILRHTQEDIQTYLYIKTMTSTLTGVVSYFVLLAVGVDFAGFWAFTIFLLNFIPTIGSIIATLFPALLALIQFETFHQFFIVLGGVGAIQVAVGNFLEPKLMGNSLNVSPFVVMMSLTLWGSIWGVAGMFLSVPITVILLIVFAHFERTRYLAVLLSGNGNLKFAEANGSEDTVEEKDIKGSADL